MEEPLINERQDTFWFNGEKKKKRCDCGVLVSELFLFFLFFSFFIFFIFFILFTDLFLLPFLKKNQSLIISTHK